MAKKKKPRNGNKNLLKGRIVLRTGEALVEDEQPWSAAEPEVVIGELDGPVGYALASLIGGPEKGDKLLFWFLSGAPSRAERRF